MSLPATAEHVASAEPLLDVIFPLAFGTVLSESDMSAIAGVPPIGFVFALEFTEGLDLGDQASGAAAFSREFTDELTLADGEVTVRRNVTVTDGLALADQVIVSKGKTVTDVLGLSDSVTIIKRRLHPGPADMVLDDPGGLDLVLEDAGHAGFVVEELDTFYDSDPTGNDLELE